MIDNINVVGLELSTEYKEEWENALNKVLKSSVDLNKNAVNLIKIRIGKQVSKEKLGIITENLQKQFRKMKIKNCIFVPLVDGYIQDVDIKCIEVVHK